MATATSAPLADAKGISLVFNLPTASKTKNIVDVAVTRVTECDCQICVWNDIFYRGKTQLFRLRSEPELDTVKIVVCHKGSKYALTQTVYKENGTILLEHYKSINQVVFKSNYSDKKGFKYDKEKNQLVELVSITTDSKSKEWSPLVFNKTPMQGNGTPQGPIPAQ